MAQAVLMIDFAFHKIGKGFYAPVRMHGEAAYIVIGIVGIESVQHEKGIEIVYCGGAEHSHQADARAVHGRAACHNFFDTALSHENLLF